MRGRSEAAKKSEAALDTGHHYSLDWNTGLTFFHFIFYSGSLPVVDWLLELSVVNVIIISSSVIVVTTCTLINTNIASEDQKLVDRTVIGKQHY